MQTVGAYVKKSFILAVVIIAWIITLAFAVPALLLLLPSKTTSGIFLVAPDYSSEIGNIIVFAIILFLGYKAYKVARTAESIPQEFIKMMPAIIMWVLIIGLGAEFFAVNNDNTDCQRYNYNDKLNGGVKKFNGKKYTINLCGNGGNINGRFDRVRVEILDEKGELQAKRYFSVFWDGRPGHFPIETGPDKIIYYDDAADDEHSQRDINIPPTTIDWIRARLALFN
jgi:hypothetical protein